MSETRIYRNVKVADLPVLDVPVVISGYEGVPRVAPSHGAHGAGVGLLNGVHQHNNGDGVGVAYFHSYVCVWRGDF